MSDDNAPGVPPTERSADLGSPDVTTMRRIRELFTRAEPLVETAQFDSVLDPLEVQIQQFKGGAPGLKERGLPTGRKHEVSRPVRKPTQSDANHKTVADRLPIDILLRVE